MAEAAVWQTLNAWLEQGHSCVLATIVKTAGSTPRQPGARMVVREDGTTIGTVGGGALELAVQQAAREALQTGAAEPRLLGYELGKDLGMSCGGYAEIFLEPIQEAPHLVLFGAGHIGQVLGPLAAQLGFVLTLIDDRVELATAERYPWAKTILHSYDPADWRQLNFGRTYCVVLTPSHETDFRVVYALMAMKPAPVYVGMIGSQRKRRVIEQQLLERGVPAPQISELHTPMGLAIGAETPAEIAVSIAAELIRSRRVASA